jgi:Ala-tRNA(Pro) deacylase
LFVDAEVWNAPSLHAHPLRNDATLVLSHDALVRFLAATGHRHQVVNLPTT